MNKNKKATHERKWVCFFCTINVNNKPNRNKWKRIQYQKILKTNQNDNRSIESDNPFDKMIK